MMLERLWQALTVTTGISLAPTGTRVVRTVGRVSLTAAHSVHVVEADGERFVIGCHPGGLTVLNRQAERAERETKT